MGKENEAEGKKRSPSTSSGDSISQMEEMKTKTPFPKSIFFILGNEFCERYSYYGMRTILVLYLTYYLHWDENTSTAVYHAFTVLAYLFPLVGAMIADSWWGKYNTILWLSIVYAIGMVVNTLGAIGDLGDLTVHAVLSSIGLFIIAFGTGGIKPCVSAFGGDQFDTDQEDYRRSFFSLFYFAINAGSLISTLVSPIIRDEVDCFGDDCYALAFGVPAILMVVAILLFLIGSSSYKKYPPQGNVFVLVSATMASAVKKRFKVKSSERNKDHWLDYANDGTNDILIRDIKYVLNVLVIFIPLPLFWALFDQQGSRWTLQAVRMDGYVGDLRILPDQMQICNPLLIVTLIPLFEVTLYPCLKRMHINFSPLRRMTAGMILAGISFVVAAVIQMMIDVNLTQVPYNMQQTSLRVINAADCDLRIESNIYPDWNPENEGSGRLILPPEEETDTLESFVPPGSHEIFYFCSGDPETQSGVVELEGELVYDLIISRNSSSSTLQHLFTSHPTDKSLNGNAIVGIVNTFDSNLTYIQTLAEEEGRDTGWIAPNSRFDVGAIKDRGKKSITLEVDGVSVTREFDTQTGALYTLVARANNPSNEVSEDNFVLDSYTDIYQNDVSIFWMIPQYFIITLGEVFLSVTGLEFAYSQAPPSMKSVLTSFWLFTVSIGNIIVLIVAEARLVPKQADEYFLFAGLIGVAAILFIILAVRYKYVDESEFIDFDECENSTTDEKERGKDNNAYDENTEM